MIPETQFALSNPSDPFALEPSGPLDPSSAADDEGLGADGTNVAPPVGTGGGVDDQIDISGMFSEDPTDPTSTPARDTAVAR